MAEKKRVYKLLEGNAWNPLMGYPRNEPCFCGSEKKFKKCCGPDVLPYCTMEAAEKFNAFMKMRGYK